MDKSKTMEIPAGFDPETEFLFADPDTPIKKSPPKKDPLKTCKDKNELYQEMLNQNTYTDIVDTILKYLK
jgi:hypothetical protein